jgi:hypothetical protein
MLLFLNLLLNREGDSIDSCQSIPRRTRAPRSWATNPQQYYSIEFAPNESKLPPPNNEGKPPKRIVANNSRLKELNRDRDSILLYSDLLVTCDRVLSSFSLLFRRNPLKYKIVSLIFYWLCMIGNPSQEAKRNALFKSSTSAIKLKILANWATDSSVSFHTCSD